LRELQWFPDGERIKTNLRLSQGIVKVLVLYIIQFGKEAQNRVKEARNA
jgi:predicted DNA-binding antitoxin AbrB/MazE fold protein